MFVGRLVVVSACGVELRPRSPPGGAMVLQSSSRCLVGVYMLFAIKAVAVAVVGVM